MIKDSGKAIKILLYLSIIALIINYFFLILFAFTIPSFDGLSITEKFQKTLYTSSYFGYVLLSTQTFFFFCINRVSLLLEHDSNRKSNETIKKTKRSSGVGFIFGLLMISTFFLFIETRFDVIINIYVFNADQGIALGVTDEQLIYAAVWVVIFGTFFALSVVFTNFYLGRLITYYADQMNKTSQSKKWKLFYAFGVVWSLQFLISYFLPIMVSLAVYGALTGLFALVIFSLLRQNIKEIKFQSDFAAKREIKNDKMQKSKYFERVVQVSMLFSLIFFSVLWFGATYYYSRHKAWYDWGFYVALGAILLLFPLFSLIYAKRPISQRILKKCFLIFSLLALFYFVLAIFSYDELLTNYLFAILFQGRINFVNVSSGFLYKPGQYILLFMLFFANMVSLVGLKKGLLPTEKTDKRKFKDYFNVLKYNKSSKLFLALFASLVVFSLVSYEGLGAYVELENDKYFCPRISFWEWDDWTDHDNATLDKLAKYDMNLYGGHPYGDQYMTRMKDYYERGIKVRPTGDNRGWIDWIENKSTYGWNFCPVDGFIEDIENGGSLYKFDRDKNEDERAEYEELIDYVQKHNFTQSFTAMHTTINDQRDGDLDVSIFNQILSFPPLDWDSWNWMLYRSESATSYEEESPYFTYLWVKEIKDTVKELYGDKYLDKLSISVGVTAEDRNLYTKDDGLDELVWDLRICDALEIPEVVIFILNPLNGSDFLGMYGLKGLREIAEGINDWDTLKLYYKRSATFFGNIKYLENPTGSVFGNYWLDIFLDDRMIFFAITWMIMQIITYFAFVKEKLSLKLSKEQIKPEK